MAKQQSYALNAEPVRLAVMAPLFALLIFLVPIPAWVIDDWYSRDMYPWFQNIVTSVTNGLPLAVIDLLLVLTAVLTLHRAWRLFNVMRQRGVIDAIWEAARRIVRFASVVVILFYWAWGFNYRRLPLDNVPPGARPPMTVDMLQSGFADAASLASRLRPVVENDQGHFHSIKLDLKDPMNEALRIVHRTPLETPSVPKSSLVLSPFFRWSGVTGMVNPFGLESILSPDLLPFERPFVLAHEWAHLAGQADEAEASAVGWLACMKASPVAAYSASLFLISESAAAMPAEARQTSMARLDSGVKADLDAIENRMRQQRPAVRRVSSQAYDQYLRANRVADGNASYGRALTLILSAPFKDALGTYTVSR
jgi:hypothetical protein